MMRCIALLPLLAAVLLSVVVPARAGEKDAVHIAQMLQIPAGESVDDAVCIFCSIHADGTVKGDLVTVFGSVELSGRAEHDLVSVFGNVQAEKNAEVGGDLVSILGRASLSDGTMVRKDLVSVFGKLSVADSSMVGGERVRVGIWFGGLPALMCFVILLFLVLAIRSHVVHRRNAELLD